MGLRVLIAGGGLGGLAAAVALRRSGQEALVFEQAPRLSEVGAGIQLGPNATRVLHGWALGPALRERAAFPARLVIRSANDARQLGALQLGKAIESRYGAPYATVHRADFQELLYAAASREGAVTRTDAHVASADDRDNRVVLEMRDGARHEGDVLVAADGVWSLLREQLLRDGMAPATGHVAYRATVEQARLPAPLRSDDVTAWLGPGVHVVAYPVRAGELLNVVAIVETQRQDGSRDWDQEGVAGELRAAAGPLHASLRDLLDAMPAWRKWPVHDREPLKGPGEMARGRVALLGDAAHPMRPYLAQGAGMAIEDASALARCLQGAASAAVRSALAAYADARWQRCARVQATARRNGRVFHAHGLVKFGRDAAMLLAGERLLDQPWLYGRS